MTEYLVDVEDVWMTSSGGIFDDETISGVETGWDHACAVCHVLHRTHYFWMNIFQSAQPHNTSVCIKILEENGTDSTCDNNVQEKSKLQFQTI